MYLIIKSFLLYLFSWVARAVNRPQNMGPSMIFPLTGNAYPIGYYHVTMSIGQPPQPYFLDIDTGSVLTWLQCDAPCVKCTPAPNSLYRPNNNRVECEDPICVALHGPENHHCEAPDDQRDYEILWKGTILSWYFLFQEHGNSCLGILNGGEVGLGNLNVLGDVSMQDKMVIYDNERQKIGWAAANCSRLLNSLPN